VEVTTIESTATTDGKELPLGRFLQLPEALELVDVTHTEKAVGGRNKVVRCLSSSSYALKLQRLAECSIADTIAISIIPIIVSIVDNVAGRRDLLTLKLPQQIQ
jgi:hypothetical protein